MADRGFPARCGADPRERSEDTPESTRAGGHQHGGSVGLLHILTNTLHPERYQGGHRKPPYFEGWYYKLVDASERHRYAVIPGLYRGSDVESSHAFVQFLDGMTGDVAYHRYLTTAFAAMPGEFDLRVGRNRFTVDGVTLDLEAPEGTVRGELSFSGITPWPVTLRSPGIMGWYAWLPFMECYHGVLSLDHTISGTLEVDGSVVHFSGGRGYTEKDWGRRFPAAHIWFQSNHLEQPGTSVTASVALIPWLRGTFRGFIVGVWHAGRLYRFTTYTGARVESLSVTDETVKWTLRDRRYRLEMRIQRTATGLLYAPDVEDMSGRVAETMQAAADVRLSRLEGSTEETVLSAKARNGGLEVVGDVARLLT